MNTMMSLEKLAEFAAMNEARIDKDIAALNKDKADNRRSLGQQIIETAKDKGYDHRNMIQIFKHSPVPPTTLSNCCRKHDQRLPSLNALKLAAKTVDALPINSNTK